jgi:uncharacterized protein YlxP (DUF503 family)
VGAAPDAFVCVIEARIHVERSHSLKAKRQLIRSLRDTIRRRFGAAVAEIGGREAWQSSTLLIALVGGGEVVERAERVERYVAARCPDGTAFTRDLRSLEDLRG